MALSLCLFGTAAYWFLQYVRRQQTLNKGSTFHQRRNKSLSDLLEQESIIVQGQLSARGRTALVPPIPYLKQLLACLQVSPYSLTLSCL